MSDIAKMLEELCPNGVEYKPLGEVCEFRRGKALQKSDKGKGNTAIILVW